MEFMWILAGFVGYKYPTYKNKAAVCLPLPAEEQIIGCAPRTKNVLKMVRMAHPTKNRFNRIIKYANQPI